MRNSFLSLILFPLIFFGQENNALLCADGKDNDGNGLTDCEETSCMNLVGFENGCSICPNGLSFGDYIISHTPGCSPSDTELSGALGVNDFDNPSTDNVPEFVYLGNGGSLKVGFSNNLLSNSGDANEDLWFFEIGPAVEPFEVALRPFDLFTKIELQSLGIPDADEDGFYEIAIVEGANSALDIDFVLNGFEAGKLIFDAVGITDVPGDFDLCNRNTPGSDIDAVCALFTIDLECELPVENASVVEFCNCLEEDNPIYGKYCDTNNLILIPTAFTPDGNGLNDVFPVLTKDNQPVAINSYRIYNRWGQLVFNRNNFINYSKENFWDGKNKNEDAEIGVYLYLIEVEFENGLQSIYKGNVTLIR